MKTQHTNFSLLTLANRRNTPPVGRSHGKTSRFLFFALLVGLLTLGSTSAWAADGYYAVHGNNWQGTESGQWNDNNNKARMSHQADGVYWCDKVAVSNGTTILFKILYGSGYDGSGFDWNNQKDATLIDNSRGNATLLNDNSDNRIQYTATENVDLYIYTNGTKVWANAVKSGATELTVNAYFIQGDLWGKNNSTNDWNKYISCPVLTFSPAKELAYTTFLIPVASNSTTVNARFELFSWDGSSYGSTAEGYTTYSNISSNLISDGIDFSVTGSGAVGTISKNKLVVTIPGTGNAHTSAKLVRFEYTSNRFNVNVSDAPAMAGTWYLYIDKEKKGTFDASGNLIVNDFPATASNDGFHSIFVANEDGLTGDTYNGTIKMRKTQGVVWLGGAYIDIQGCSSEGITWQQGTLGKNDNFSSYSSWSRIASDNSGDFRGGFKLSASGNTLFSLNNGVLTIKKQGDYIAPEPDPTPDPEPEATCTTFPVGETLYLRCGNEDGSYWDWQDANHFYATFMDNNNTPLWSDCMTSTEEAHVHKIVISDDAAGASKVKIELRNATCTDYWSSECTMSINGTNNCIYKTEYNGAAVWETHGDGFNCGSSEEPEEPECENTTTVTVHPNNGNDTFTMTEVCVGGTISTIPSASVGSWGNGSVTWYTDEGCTSNVFTLNSSTVTANMHLYAKWGVTGDHYLVGDFGMHDNGTNWAYNSSMTMRNTDGVASVTFIAPQGCNRFEILTSRSSWPAIANQSGLIAPSTPTLNWGNGYGPDNNQHFYFTLDAPKKVTISYNGKVSVTAENYDVVKTGWTVVSPTLLGSGSDDNASNADDGNYMGSGYNTSAGEMNSNGERVFEDVAPGTYKFWIGKKNTALNKQKQQIEVFGAAHVDIDNSSLGTYGSLASVNNPAFNRNMPQDDRLHRRVTFTLTQTADIKIAFDGGKITVNVQPTHTVTFKDGATTLSTVQVFDGRKVTAAVHDKSGYNFVKWHEAGESDEFDFANTPITGNLDLYGEWEYNHISSVSLNESTHSTWVGNSDFTLTLTKDPSDLSAKSVVWSSNNMSVATVSNNGTVHVEEGAGITEETVVRITCTVTDQYDASRSAYCDVTVAPCQMTTDNLYSMTVEGYNSSTGTGGSATLTGLWNSSEPATITVCNVRIGNNGGSNEYYAYDNSGQDNTIGTVMIEQSTSNDRDKWQMITSGTANVYYLKNMYTGKYMYCGATNTNDSKGNGWSDNPDWLLRSVYTSKTNGETDSYKFYLAKDEWKNDVIVSRADASNNANPTATDYALSRQQLTGTPNVWSNVVANTVSASRGATQGGDNYKGFQSSFVNIDNEYPNPAYIPSQMNSSYYRMNTNATVQANLAAALVKGAVITVSLYADAATSVKLTKTDETEIATINLSADAALDYTYTVNTASLLLGESAFIIKAADNHAAIASISVSRTHAADPDDPALEWDVVDLETTGITQSALGGNIVHVATSALSEGAIRYTSSNPAVATVAADGTVTPIMQGNTIITATIEEAGCYDEASITYTITLTEPTLAERIAADAGEGITLTHNYSEDVVINKAVTINGAGHSIGNLTVQNQGDLTIGSALTVNDFTLWSNAGNQTTPATAGQVHNADRLTVSGHAYFEYALDPNTTNGAAADWYTFTVPFPVNARTGVARYQDGTTNWHNRAGGLNTSLQTERNYAIMRYYPELRAQGKYGWKKYYETLQPGEMYIMTTDHYYSIYRFEMAAGGELNVTNTIAMQPHPASEASDANWNAVGNGTLYHAQVANTVFVQYLPAGANAFEVIVTDEKAFVTGTAFAVQKGEGSLTLSENSSLDLLAPARRMAQQSTGRYALEIAPEGGTYTDRLYVSASDEATGTYTEGNDVPKMGGFGTPTIPQLWVNAYSTRLCANQAQLLNGTADFDLGLSAPANGLYTLTAATQPNDGSQLWLTYNGALLWNLSEAAYTLSLDKGNATGYGLRIIVPQLTPTALDDLRGSDSDSATKFLHNGHLYIRRANRLYDATGRIAQ